MNKQEIISVLNDVRSNNERWADQTSLIADSINLDGLIEPVNYEESDLYIWLKSNKSSISAFSWYKELQQAHVKAHYSYSDLFESATRKFNPKTRERLLQDFEHVTLDISEFNHTIERIEKDITDMADVLYLDFVLKSNAINRKHEVESSNHNDTDSKLINDVNQSKDTFVDESDINNQVTTDLEYSDTNNQIKDDSSSTDAETTKNTDFEEKTENSNVVAQIDEESNAKNESEAEDLENLSDSNEMKAIDINEFEKINKVKNQIEIDSKTMLLGKKLQESTAKSKPESAAQSVKPAIDNAKLKSDYESIKSDLKANENLTRHIELKEQNLKRLQSEKALFEQELKHLEETQKLSQQGIDQLEQHLSLKQEEVELEQLDNEKLLELNSGERDQKVEQLKRIEELKTDLKNQVIELEQENIKDQLVQEDIKKKPSIEKQFEAVKSNKVSELDSLKLQFNEKNEELVTLKEQVNLLADELAGIEDEIESKQQSIDDLEEKEKSKNAEKTLKLEANANIIKQRNQTINIINHDLDVLTNDESKAQKELDALIINLEKVKKTISSIDDINDAEIDEIEAQQVERQNKLSEVFNQKTNKQTEIDEIQKRIDDAEETLKALKSDLNKEQDETSEKQLETID